MPSLPALATHANRASPRPAKGSRRGGMSTAPANFLPNASVCLMLCFLVFPNHILHGSPEAFLVFDFCFVFRTLLFTNCSHCVVLGNYQIKTQNDISNVLLHMSFNSFAPFNDKCDNNILDKSEMMTG